VEGIPARKVLNFGSLAQLGTLRMNSLHFMAKYFCHQAAKTQRNIQTKIFLCAFEFLWQFSGSSG
jgi:hypothetical protein